MFIIAEAGVNHNGDIETAKKLVDMAKRSGADAVKFQTFKAQDIVDINEKKVNYQEINDSTNETQFEMLKRLELTYDEFRELKKYCDDVGIIFLSTPFSVEALKFLISIDMPIIKLSSTEITNYPFLVEVAKCNKPIILSTGMSYFDEVANAVSILQENGENNITLLHCTTNYPTLIEEVNLRAIETLKKLVKNVGYSDHTTNSLAAVLATSLGACVIERHITLNKRMKGPDHKASAMEKEFTEYVAQIRNAEIALGDGIKRPTKSEESMRKKVRRSLVAKTNIKKGDVINLSMLECKRPALGLSPIFYTDILDKKVIMDIEKGKYVLEEYLET
ncbi:N-acetylneuraminate synthase [Epulopiscium sp. SCG-B10WGA-EpuloA2]|nr:N-acetylneuraminate synthase [Epulopiscium sp. SCG-B10WGA-EpuloA2]